MNKRNVYEKEAMFRVFEHSFFDFLSRSKRTKNLGQG